MVCWRFGDVFAKKTLVPSACARPSHPSLAGPALLRRARRSRVARGVLSAPERPRAAGSPGVDVALGAPITVAALPESVEEVAAYLRSLTLEEITLLWSRIALGSFLAHPDSSTRPVFFFVHNAS